MMVVVTRGIDVSVGSIVGLSGIVAGAIFRSHPGVGLIPGILAALITGLALGYLNGVLVSRAKIPPIVVTLGGLSAYRGLAFIVSKGKQVDSNDIPEPLSNWSLHGPFTIGGVTIHWILLMAILLALLASWFLRRTRAGRDIFAVGSNPEAALLRGVPVDRTKAMVYAITGLLAGFGGVIYASRYGFVNPGTAGQGLELVVIAAVVIGGTNVSGGSGTVLGVVLGCLLLASINVALSVMGIEENWQQLVYGIVILVGVLLDTFVRRALIGKEAG
jgi:rhamnose transport system permease protein